MASAGQQNPTITMISLYAEKETEKATLELYKQLEQIDFPEGVGITINNLAEAESGILRKDGKVVDISLAHCYTLQDALREMARLIMEPRYDDAPRTVTY